MDVETVLTSIVDVAIRRGVDALVLTGDVADASNKHIEATGILSRTLLRMISAEIPVFMVAGNHDYDVLALISDQLDSPLVRCLGRGQTWEHATIQRDGRDVLRLVGWSFADLSVRTSSLPDFPRDLPPGIPTIGVLHADLDVAESKYHPVRLAELQSAPVSAWLLGHIHTPRHIRDGGPMVLYPGSPQPLDPGERGLHGPWLLEVAGDGAVSAEMLPLSTLRYDDLDVDVSGVEREVEATDRVLTALQAHARDSAENHPALRRCVVRLRLVGRAPAFGEIAQAAEQLRQEREVQCGDILVTVDAVTNETRPALDLEKLSVGSGPVATLAGLARRLDGGALKASDQPLLDAAATALRDARSASAFTPLMQSRDAENDFSADVRDRLTRQVYRLLDEVLDQQANAD